MPQPLVTQEKITLMLSLVPFLLERGPTPIRTLAEHFDVDAETIRSIIRFFGVAGIPGETATYQHEDLFDIDWDALEQRDEAVLIRTVVVSDRPRFSPREVAALLAGLQYLRNVPSIATEDEIDQLVMKLTRATGLPASRIDIESSQAPAHLKQLHSARRNGAMVSFTYIDSSGSKSSRTVSPIQLESVDEVWYFRAFCEERRGERLFRVDRMRDVSILDSRSVHSVASSRTVASFAKKRSLFTPDENAVETSLRFHAPVHGRLRSYDVSVDRQMGSVLLADANRASRLAAEAPGIIEILHPALARSVVHAWARMALEQYDE